MNMQCARGLFVLLNLGFSFVQGMEVKLYIPNPFLFLNTVTQKKFTLSEEDAKKFDFTDTLNDAYSREVHKADGDKKKFIIAADMVNHLKDSARSISGLSITPRNVINASQIVCQMGLMESDQLLLCAADVAMAVRLATYMGVNPKSVLAKNLGEASIFSGYLKTLLDVCSPEEPNSLLAEQTDTIVSWLDPKTRELFLYDSMYRCTPWNSVDFDKPETILPWLKYPATRLFHEEHEEKSVGKILCKELDVAYPYYKHDIVDSETIFAHIPFFVRYKCANLNDLYSNTAKKQLQSVDIACLKSNEAKDITVNAECFDFSTLSIKDLSEMSHVTLSVHGQPIHNATLNLFAESGYWQLNGGATRSLSYHIPPSNWERNRIGEAIAWVVGTAALMYTIYRGVRYYQNCAWNTCKISIENLLTTHVTPETLPTHQLVHRGRTHGLTNETYAVLEKVISPLQRTEPAILVDHSIYDRCTETLRQVHAADDAYFNSYHSCASNGVVGVFIGIYPLISRVIRYFATRTEPKKFEYACRVTGILDPEQVENAPKVPKPKNRRYEE